MSTTYLSSHHVVVVADSPLEAARQHFLIQHESTAPVYEVGTEEDGIVTVDLSTDSVSEPR